MANNKNRLAKLEQANGKGEKTQYLCTSYAKDTGYKAKPFMGAGKPLTFETLDAMTKYFDKHTELELIHIAVVYASEAVKDGSESR